MKLIKASYQIITPINGEEILKQIELAARTCYKSEGKIEYAEALNGTSLTPTFYASSARKLIPKLISNNHEAMLEFGGMITVKIICDRGISHELVRHRIASFAQESTRYNNYGKDEHISFIIPCWLDYIPELESNSISELEVFIPDKSIGIGDRNCVDDGFSWALDMLQSQNKYFNKIKFFHWTPQQARSVLPISLKTEVNISANIREWRYIFKLRTANAAHPQMRELMCPLLDEFKKRIPILFDDIKY